MTLKPLSDVQVEVEEVSSPPPPSYRVNRNTIILWTVILLALLLVFLVVPRGEQVVISSYVLTPTPEETETTLPTFKFSTVAFSSPYGEVLGAIEVGRVYTMTEEVQGWIFLDVEGSGGVWVREYEFLGQAAPAPTPTLAPTATPQPPVYVPVPQPVYVQPQPICRDAVVDGVNMGQVCGATYDEMMAEVQRVVENAPLPGESMP